MSDVGALATSIEHLVVSMAREVVDTDVMVVGIGTPVALAAALLARELHAPGLGILMPGARDPAEQELSRYLADPVGAVARSTDRLSRIAILDAIRSGEVSLQFVRPAQVDGGLRINTELLASAGGDRLLVGPVALPDVVELVGRVVAYLPRHDRSCLVPDVDVVTAPRPGTSRGIAAVITPLAVLRAGDGVPRLAGYRRSSSAQEVQELTGFPLALSGCQPLPGPTDWELSVLRSVVDPHGLCGLEDPGSRSSARQELTALWAQGRVGTELAT